MCMHACMHAYCLHTPIDVSCRVVVFVQMHCVCNTTKQILNTHVQNQMADSYVQQLLNLKIRFVVGSIMFMKMFLCLRLVLYFVLFRPFLNPYFSHAPSSSSLVIFDRKKNGWDVCMRVCTRILRELFASSSGISSSSCLQTVRRGSRW